MIRLLSLFVSFVLLIVGTSVVTGQNVTPIYSENFNSVPEFSLPAGWGEFNQSDGSEGGIGHGDEFKGWTVVTPSTLAALGGNRVNNPNVYSGNSVYAESDVRSGIQVQYLYTPNYDLSSAQGTVVIDFDSNFMQNQDSLNFIEYTLQGNQITVNANGEVSGMDNVTWLPLFYWVDAAEPPQYTVGGVLDSYRLFTEQGLNDSVAEAYEWYVGAGPLESLAPYVQGRIQDDATMWKRHETFAVPNVAGQRNVRFRIFQGGGASWFWGIDNWVVGTTSNFPPDKPSILTVSAELLLTPADVTVTSSAFSDTDNGTHQSSTWQVATDAAFLNIIYTSPLNTTNKTSFVIPANRLVPGKFHYVRVAYTDNGGGTSPFSNAGSFYVSAPGTPTFLFENFNGESDASLTTQGWKISQTASAKETGATLWNMGQSRSPNPAGPDGYPTGGQYIISDSDAGDGSDDQGTGAAYDLVTPAFNTTGASEVWLHCAISCVLNDNGEGTFDIGISYDNGSTFTDILRCVSSRRTVAPLPQIGINGAERMGGLYGPFDFKLPAEAVNKTNVRLRFRQFEPDDEWYIAIDDLRIDTLKPVGSQSLLTQNFNNGIPTNWTVTTNNSAAGETWGTQPLETKNVDWALNPNLTNVGNGRQLAVLAGQGYAITMTRNNDTVTTLDSPAINCSGMKDVFMAVDIEWLDFKSGQTIEVSVDGGQTYRPIFTNGLGMYQGIEGTVFQRYYFAVPSASGQSAVKFRFSQKGPQDASGFWAIDNFEVTGNPGEVPITEFMIY